MQLKDGSGFFTKLDVLALCIAALGHDAGHFALNNAFLINSDHEIVRKYGAVSALEHFHVSKLMEVLEFGVTLMEVFPWRPTGREILLCRCLASSRTCRVKLQGEQPIHDFPSA
eukprot:6200815-Pyramimonas_sp.AAC.1